MLIAITSEGSDPSSSFAEMFGRAPFIIFYDKVKNTFESLRNPYANIFGGSGIQTSQFIIEKNVGAVITIDIGLNPLRLLKSAGIEVYSCSKIQVQEIVKVFKEDKLRKVEYAIAVNFSNRMKKRRRNCDRKN